MHVECIVQANRVSSTRGRQNGDHRKHNGCQGSDSSNTAKSHTHALVKYIASVWRAYCSENDAMWVPSLHLTVMLGAGTHKRQTCSSTTPDDAADMYVCNAVPVIQWSAGNSS